MSAPATSPHAARGHDAGHHEDSKFHIFVQIAMLLAFITGVEIILIYLPLPAWLLISTLSILSLVKFLYVIFYFMHLKWDKMFCTTLFFIGLVLATGTAGALMAIFSAADSKPVGGLYDEGL